MIRSNQDPCSATRLRRVAVLSAAAIAAIPASALYAAPTNDSVVTAATAVEYVISTSGATALGAITKGAATNTVNDSTGPNRGIYALGLDSLTIGRSTYTQTASRQFLGTYDKNAAATGETVAADRFRYMYHEVGSSAGVSELLRSNGLLSGSAIPGTPSESRPLWVMGYKQNAANTFKGQLAGVPLGGYNPENPQPRVQIAWSDVKTTQTFAQPGAASASAIPQGIGYGQGRNSGGTNFQQLIGAVNVTNESTGNSNDSHLRNEDVAVVPFTISANPGTGLDHIKETEGRFLQTHGRLPNGANFNSSTREIGSGTRNQGANNLNLDPSFGWGERDRKATVAYTSPNPNGSVGNVNVAVGDEADPTKSLDGTASSTIQFKEHRIGPDVRFADKNSGGSGIRPIVAQSRMALGILSVGDVGDRGRAGNTSGNVTPLRVLAIDFDEQVGEAGSGGFKQPTAIDVTEGNYQMWSAAQAVTVIGSTGAAGVLGNVGSDTAAKPIWQDQRDVNGASVADVTGVHRKFINNIAGSVAEFSQALNEQTPADGIIAAGFIPNQLMKVTKTRDGGIQSSRALSNSDPDGAGPGLSEQALYTAAVASNNPGTLGASLNWTRAGDHNGNLAGNQVKYNISANNAATGVNTKVINVTTRTTLAGDINGDTVRDFRDTAALASAYAASTANGTIAGIGNVSNLSGTLSSDELIVLSDFDADGNISGTHASPTFVAVERDDVRFFLYGAAVDTDKFTLDDGSGTVLDATDGNGSNNPSDQQRREDGVRLGALRKNAAIDAFNAQIDTIGAPAGLKFNKHDVNDDGKGDFYDAAIVDGFNGKNITSFDDQLNAVLATNQLAKGTTFVGVGNTTDPNVDGTTQRAGINLVDAELNDDQVINAADVAQMNVGLTGVLNESWTAGVSHKVGPHTIKIARTGSGGVSMPVGASLRIAAGTLAAGGTQDPFSGNDASQGRHLAIHTEAAGTFSITNGVKTVAAITGDGNTNVTPDTESTSATLIAPSIRQTGLALNGTAAKLASVKLTGNGPTNVIGTLTIATDSGAYRGQLDLGPSTLVLKNTSFASVADMVAAGYNNGDWLGNGVTSVTAATDPNGLTAVGFFDNAEFGATEFEGVTGIDSDDVIVKYTYYGDADLNGIVDPDDFNQFLAGFQDNTLPRTWLYGDFDYNNVIDPDDFNLFLAAFQFNGSPLSELVNSIEMSSLSSADQQLLLGAVAAVPEPTSLGLLGLAAGGLLARRRSRRS